MQSPTSGILFVMIRRTRAGETCGLTRPLLSYRITDRITDRITERITERIGTRKNFFKIFFRARIACYRIFFLCFALKAFIWCVPSLFYFQITSTNISTGEDIKFQQKKKKKIHEGGCTWNWRDKRRCAVK